MNPAIEVGMTLDEGERRLILATLEVYPHKPEASEVLGISLKTLYARLNGYLAHHQMRLEPTRNP